MEAKGDSKMSSGCSNIPPLVFLSDYRGDYFEYENAIYELFTADFIDSKPVFRGQNLGLKRHPLYRDREATFWHILSEGPIEYERTPDLRRYERISWPKSIIEFCHSSCERIKVWENNRKGENRILLWCEDIEYLVVLADRINYILFWTAYPVTKGHKKRKLQKEYEEYIKQSI